MTPKKYGASWIFFCSKSASGRFCFRYARATTIEANAKRTPSKQQISILIGKLAFYSPIFHLAQHPLHHLHFELARNLLDTNHRNPIARFTLFEYATAFAGQKATIQTFAIATSTRCVCSVLRRRSLLSYTAKATPVFTFIVAACDFVNRNFRASGETIPTAKLNYS